MICKISSDHILIDTIFSCKWVKIFVNVDMFSSQYKNSPYPPIV